MMLCCLAWKRPLDQSILDELVQLVVALAVPWAAVRFLDILLRGKFLLMFNSGFRSFLFWDEMLLILVPVLFLRVKKYRESHYHLFMGCVLVVLGGMAYRFDPTTFAYRPWSLSYYTPTVIEILISLGFISTCIILFLVAVKRLPILPAPVQQWYDLEEYYKRIYPYVQMSGYVDKDQYRPSYAD